MVTKTEKFNSSQLKQGLPDIQSGDTVKVYQKIKDKGKEKTLISEGLVLSVKHGKGISSTIKIRKTYSGVGVEKTIPVHSPSIEKIEIVKKGKVRRAKLYYLREAKGKRGKLKKIDFEQTETTENVVKKEESVNEETEVKPEIEKTEEVKEEKEVK
jgi:large subunit ribosomal protein L19